METEKQPVWSDFAPLLVACGRGWRKALNALLSEHNLSDATAAPLLALVRHGDKIPQSTLAERVGVEGPTLVRVLDGLEADDLIGRTPDPGDRRIKLVCLTEKGKVTAQKCEDLVVALRKDMLGDLRPEDICSALAVMRSIAAKTGALPALLQLED